MRFIICDLITGTVLDEAPLVIAEDLTRQLKGVGEGKFFAPFFDGEGRLYTSRYWEKLIVPWKSLILVTDEGGRIIWHGIPNSNATPGINGQEIPCRTVEEYLLRRYMPTAEFLDVDQATIFTAMINAANVNGIGLEVDAPPTGAILERLFQDAENTRIGDRLTELSNASPGFDWMIDVQWADAAQSRVRKIARMRPTMGNRTTTPEHAFISGVNITDATPETRWGQGDAATLVTAVGDGEGESRLISAPGIDTIREAAGWPRLEERRNFSGVDSEETIAAHMARMKQAFFGGQTLVTLEAKIPGDDDHYTGPADLTLGDTAQINVRVGQDPVDLDKFAIELDAVWPVVGYSLSQDMKTWKPTLADLTGGDLGASG